MHFFSLNKKQLICLQLISEGVVRQSGASIYNSM